LASVANPMDDISVRQLRFDFSKIETEQFVWSQSNPEFAIFINALGIHVPFFERFLVQVMRRYRDRIRDPELLEDVQRIIGQESHHAFNFVQWNQAMARRYPKVSVLAEEAKGYFERALNDKDQKFQIGFTAGYETFTFLAGMIILDRYEAFMGRADPVMRALWVWHQVEEVEHGAVAFDFFKAFYAEQEMYRKYMVVRAGCHILWQTFKGFAHIIRIEGYYRRPLKGLAAWRFFTGFALDLVKAALPVFAASYHPKRHPICNDAQNSIAVGWRRYTQSGANAHSLDEVAMQKLRSEI